jgi:hypothetical protein
MACTTPAKKGEAAEKYKTAYPAAGDRKAEVLKRIVEQELTAGNTAEAKKWIEQGLTDKVGVQYDSVAAQQMLASAQKTRDDQVAQKKAEADVKKNQPKKGVTRANYERVQEGMTLAEVEDILGKGKEMASSGNMRMMTWQGGVVNFRAVSITFEDGRVTAKAILD